MKMKIKTKKDKIIAVFLILGIILGIFAMNPIAAFNVRTFITFYEGLVQLILNGPIEIIIDSPQNITYYFGIGENYSINLSVHSDRNITSYSFSLKGLKHDIYEYDKVPFIPNISFVAARWSNNLIVYGTDSSGNNYSSSVVFYVFVNNSAPIIENISDAYICEGSNFSYIFNASDADEDVLEYSINPMYPLTPFYMRYLNATNTTLFSYEIFSGLLNKNEAGGVNSGSMLYIENVFVNDLNYSDSRQMDITVLEINNAPVISNIGVHTVWSHGENSTFYYSVKANDSEDGDQDSGNFIFNLSFIGDALFNISQAGVINFSANSSNIGVHNITVLVTDRGIENPHQNISLCGQDGGPITSIKQFSLTVTDENRPPNITSYYPVNLARAVSGDDILTFNISTYDPDGTIPDIYWYVGDSLKSYKSDMSSDEFSYIFGCGVSGDFIIKAEITDGELNDSIAWNISVSNAACPIPSATGGGGGGGGQAKKVFCQEKWGCGEWSQCRNLKEDYDKKMIDFITRDILKERCALFNWSDSICGYQERVCNDINKCKTNLTKPGYLRECFYTIFPNCSDKIKNCHSGSCEVLVDCGGPCSACPTCSDKIKNQEETETDCGGPCLPCPIKIEIPYAKYSIIFIFLLIFLIAIVIIILYLREYLKKRREFRDKILKREG